MFRFENISKIISRWKIFHGYCFEERIDVNHEFEFSLSHVHEYITQKHSNQNCDNNLQHYRSACRNNDKAIATTNNVLEFDKIMTITNMMSNKILKMFQSCVRMSVSVPAKKIKFWQMCLDTA